MENPGKLFATLAFEAFMLEIAKSKMADSKFNIAISTVIIGFES